MYEWDECPECGELGGWEHEPAQAEMPDEPGCDEAWVCVYCGHKESE